MMCMTNIDSRGRKYPLISSQYQRLIFEYYVNGVVQSHPHFDSSLLMDTFVVKFT